METSINKEVKMDHEYLAALIKNIQSLVKCPSCGAPYKAGMISVIGGSGQTFLVTLECSLCGLPTLATVAIKHQETSEPNREIFEFSKPQERKEDIANVLSHEFEPIAENHTEKKINIDDVLDMHEFLKGFNGDFKLILGE